MTPGTYTAVAAAAHFVPALLWGVIAQDIWRFIRRRRVAGAFPRVLLGLALCTALHYATWTSIALVRGHLQERSWLRGGLVAVTGGMIILLIAFARHVAILWSVRARRPTRAWLAVNYGLCTLALAANALSAIFVVDVRGWQGYWAYSAYLLVLGVAIVWDFRRGAARGSWRAGVLWQARTADVAAIGVALVLVAIQQSIPQLVGSTPLDLLLRQEPSAPGLAMYALNGTAALVFATPFVVRNMGELLPRFLAGLTTTAAVAAVWMSSATLAARTSDAEVAHWLQVAAVVAVVFLVVPAGGWLHGQLARVLFRRGRLRWRDLHDALQALPPEAGVGECCRGALVELVRIFRLRGAAVLLHDRTIVAHGAISMARLRDAWPADGAGLPRAGRVEEQVRELSPAVADALAIADVLAVVPIASPRRRWGWLFISTDLRGASFSDEDDRALGAATDQLALGLDAADLLARTVAAERSLAHAEKLAAIGELAARFAHDIRNPVTAARSLAQQLARDPAAPENTEHAGIILEELERVERQVRDLLRFARFEEYRFQPTELSALVRRTVEAFRPRLDAAGVALDLHAAVAITVTVDEEKLRQTLVNLFENALDALGGAARKRLAVSVTREDGTATIQVTDSGPGVSGTALPRLFEPFFSQKAHGTGLGLAIVKRTVDAHRGRVEAKSEDGSGLSVRIDLPLGGVP